MLLSLYFLRSSQYWLSDLHGKHPADPGPVGSHGAAAAGAAGAGAFDSQQW